MAGLTLLRLQSGQLLRIRNRAWISTPDRLFRNISLCFYPAALKRKNNEISDEVFVQHIAAHFGGLRHGENKECSDDEDLSKYLAKLRETDTFTYWMRDWAMHMKPVEG